MHYNHLSVAKSKNGRELDKNTPREILQYAIGALMYTPADHPTIGQDICTRRRKHLNTLCLCLEDAVLDVRLPEAEEALLGTFQQIDSALSKGALKPEQLPLLFIRVRTSSQLKDIYRRLGGCSELLTGFILPKFDSSVSGGYLEAMSAVNAASTSGPVYMLPILESAPILSKQTRRDELAAIRSALDSVKEMVLNVRIGGNDLCNLLRVRRKIDQTAYDIVVLCDLLKDIILTLGESYVLSAPVWEYFGATHQQEWQEGLRNELRQDLLNGFVGKTAIHPVQLEVIQQALVVDAADYADAMAIVDWNSDSAVGRGVVDSRMNEEKVHNRWAEKILAMAEVYGVEEGNT